MAYIGRGLDKISNVEVLDNLTFDGSSTSFTLQKNSVNFTPSSANNILVSIDGVVQAGNFTCSGSTIDFGVAISASSTCDFIIHYGVGVVTTPSDNSVTAAKIPNGTVSNAHLAGSIDLTSKVTGVLPEANSFPNTPAFKVTLSSNQVIAHDTLTRVTFDTEEYDTDNAFASNVFTVPSGKGGKYFFEFHTLFDDFNDQETGMMYIEIDGVKAVGSLSQLAGSGSTVNVTLHFAGVLTVTAGQTVEVVAKNFSGSNQELRSADTYFAGHKLIGV